MTLPRFQSVTSAILPSPKLQNPRPSIQDEPADDRAGFGCGTPPHPWPRIRAVDRNHCDLADVASAGGAGVAMTTRGNDHDWLGGNVSHHRAHRGGAGLRRNCRRCDRGCEDRVFYRDCVFWRIGYRGARAWTRGGDLVEFETNGDRKSSVPLRGAFSAHDAELLSACKDCPRGFVGS